MPGRRRGSTATPSTSLSDLLADLPVPRVPLSEQNPEPKVQIGPVGGTWSADQRDWVKSTGRWGR